MGVGLRGRGTRWYDDHRPCRGADGGGQRVPHPGGQAWPTPDRLHHPDGRHGLFPADRHCTMVRGLCCDAVPDGHVLSGVYWKIWGSCYCYVYIYDIIPRKIIQMIIMAMCVIKNCDYSWVFFYLMTTATAQLRVKIIKSYILT